MEQWAGAMPRPSSGHTGTRVFHSHLRSSAPFAPLSSLKSHTCIWAPSQSQSSATWPFHPVCDARAHEIDGRARGHMLC